MSVPHARIEAGHHDALTLDASAPQLWSVQQLDVLLWCAVHHSLVTVLHIPISLCLNQTDHRLIRFNLNHAGEPPELFLEEPAPSRGLSVRLVVTLVEKHNQRVLDPQRRNPDRRDRRSVRDTIQTGLYILRNGRLSVPDASTEQRASAFAPIRSIHRRVVGCIDRQAPFREIDDRVQVHQQDTGTVVRFLDRGRARCKRGAHCR